MVNLLARILFFLAKQSLSTLSAVAEQWTPISTLFRASLRPVGLPLKWLLFQWKTRKTQWSQGRPSSWKKKIWILKFHPTYFFVLCIVTIWIPWWAQVCYHSHSISWSLLDINKRADGHYFRLPALDHH